MLQNLGCLLSNHVLVNIWNNDPVSSDAQTVILTCSTYVCFSKVTLQILSSTGNSYSHWARLRSTHCTLCQWWSVFNFMEHFLTLKTNCSILHIIFHFFNALNDVTLLAWKAWQDHMLYAVLYYKPLYIKPCLLSKNTHLQWNMLCM